MLTTNRPPEWATIDALRQQLESLLNGKLEKALEATAEATTRATAIIFLIYREAQHALVKEEFYQAVARSKGRSWMAKVVNFLMTELSPKVMPTLGALKQQMSGTLEILNEDFKPARDPTVDETIAYIEARGGITKTSWDWINRQSERSRAEKKREADMLNELAEARREREKRAIDEEARGKGVSVETLLTQRNDAARDAELTARKARLQEVYVTLIANGDPITVSDAMPGDVILVAEGARLIRVRPMDAADLLACKAMI